MKYMLVALAIVVSFSLISLPVHAAGPFDMITDFFRAIWEFFFGTGTPSSNVSTLELKCADSRGNYVDECIGGTADIKWLMQDYKGRIDFCKASSNPSNMDWYGYMPFAGNMTIEIDTTTTFTLLCRGSTLTLSDSVKVVHPSQVVEETPAVTTEPIYEETPEESQEPEQANESTTNFFYDKIRASHSPVAGIAGGNITISAYVLDVNIVAEGATVEAYTKKQGGNYALMEMNSSQCTTSCAFTGRLTDLQAGNYSYYAVLRGSDGTELARTAEKQFVVYGVAVQLPSVSVSYSPATPRIGDVVTFTATATQYAGKTIVMTADDTKMSYPCTGGTCYTSNTKTKTCTASPCRLAILYSATYALSGIYKYNAVLLDNDVVVAADPPEGVKSFTLGYAGNDSHAPTVSIGAEQLDSNVFLIRAQAQDDISVPSINIYLNDGVVATCAAPPCEFMASGEDGTYSYRASAADMAGNTADTESKTFRINSTEPRIVMLSPNGGERVFAPGADYPVTWRIINPAYAAGMSMNIFLKKGAEETLLKEADPSDGGTSWTPDPQLATGDYRIVARLKDGNRTVYEDESDGMFAIARPVIRFTSQTAIVAIGDETTISWSVEGSGDYTTSLWIEKDGVKAGDIAITGSPRTWLAGLAANGEETVILNTGGNYRFTLKLESGAYNYTASSAAFAITAPQETEKPEVNMTRTPSNPQSTDSVLLAATASDNRALKRIDIYADNATKSCIVPYAAEYTCEYSQVFSTGMHYYNASATDAAGNREWTGNAAFYVSEAPTLLLAPVNGTMYRPGASQEITWSTNAQSADNYSVRLLLERDGAELGRLELLDTAATAGHMYWNTNYYYANSTMTQTVPGTGYTISATIVKDGQMTSVFDRSAAFAIVLPTIQLLTHQDGLNLTRNTTSIIMWNVVGDGRYVKRITLERNGQNMGTITTLGYAMTDTAYTWTTGVVRNDIGTTYTVPAGTGYRIAAKIEDYDGSGYTNTSRSAAFAIL